VKTRIDSTPAAARGSDGKSAPKADRTLGEQSFEQVAGRALKKDRAGGETGVELRNALPAPNLQFASVPVGTSVQPAARSESAARQQLIQKLVQAIRTSAAEGHSEISLELETGELGLRRVQLVREADGQLGITLRVDPGASGEEMIRFRAELVDALRSQGLTIKAAEIALAERVVPNGSQEPGGADPERRGRDGNRRGGRSARGGSKPTGSSSDREDVEEVTE